MSAKFVTQVFDVEGVRTVVKSIGRGRPVLFLHGAATLEGFGFASGLAEQFRVLLPSHPGMGFSGEAPHISSMSDLLIHYLNLLEKMELDQTPHLVGFSMGGWASTELAAIARERFDRVVLVAPAGLNDPNYPATALDRISPEEFPSYLSHDVSVALRYFPEGNEAADIEAFAAARRREAEAVGRLCAPFGMGHPNLRLLLHRITNRTLVVWGSEDRILPAGQAPIWISELPNAELWLVPDAGHLVLQEKPEITGRICEFLNAR